MDTSLDRTPRNGPCHSSFLFPWLSKRWTPPWNGHQGLVPAVLQSFSLFSSKMDNSLDWTPRGGPCRCAVIFLTLWLSIWQTLPYTGHLKVVSTVPLLSSLSLKKTDTSLDRTLRSFFLDSIQWTPPKTGHLELVATILQSFSLTLYKMDNSLNRKPRAGPCRSSFSWTLYKMHPLL